MKKSTILWLAFGVIAFIGIIWFFSSMNIKAAANKKQKNVQAHEKMYHQGFDVMVKTIAQEAGIPDHAIKGATEAFVKIYPAIMDARGINKEGNALMVWVQEQNPQFDTKQYYTMYEKLMDIVESTRKQLENRGNEWIAVVNDYNTYVSNPYNTWFLSESKYPQMSANIITSANTKEAIRTGEENDIEIFKDKK